MQKKWRFERTFRPEFSNRVMSRGDPPPRARDYFGLLPLALAVIAAPLAFGGTTDITRLLLDGLCALGFFGWLGSLMLQRRFPGIPTVACFALVALALLGSVHWANPKFVHRESVRAFLPVEAAVAWLPGSVDRASTEPVLLHFLALLLAFLVVADLTISSRNRWFLIKALALSGFCMALLGLFQKASGSEAMLLATAEQSGSVFFAGFRYHANAAAFLNLTWPAALALWLRSRLVGTGNGSSVWLLVFLLTFIAVFVNTSKAGQIIGALGFCGALWLARSRFGGGGRSRPVAIVSAILCLIVGAALVLPTALTSTKGWSDLVSDGTTLQLRVRTAEACLRILPDAAHFGTGPGTFHLVFPFYTDHLKDYQGFWQHAHQDYLQTAIEWGWIGFFAWAVLFGGAIVRAMQRNRIADPRENLSGKFALLAVVLVLVHALADFPLQIPAIQLAAAIHLGILWAPSRARSRGTKKPACSGPIKDGNMAVGDSNVSPG